MSKFVSDEATEKKVREAHYSNGAVEIGTIEPCREMKWTGWRVLLLEGRLFACVVLMDGTFSCAEEIQPSELGMYVDDEEAARAALGEAQGVGNG